jgi:hypothetical protein
MLNGKTHGFYETPGLPTKSQIWLSDNLLCDCADESGNYGVLFADVFEEGRRQAHSEMVRTSARKGIR